METASAFFGGIVFTIVVAFMYFKWDESRQRKKARRVQATRRSGPYPPDVPKHRDSDTFEP